MKEMWRDWCADDEGFGTLEIILILAVLVAIAVVFRKWIIQWVNDLIGSAQSELDRHQGDTDLLVLPYD